MTTGDALLAAIRANPDDDLVRLVYADYLEENGDPDRAELIRVQIELTHLPPDAPNWLDTDGRGKLLLAANRTRWLGDRLKVAPNPAWVFRRGFPDELDFSRERIEEAGAITLASSPYLAEVVSLKLQTNWIRDEGVIALAASPHIARVEFFDLNHNGIGAPGATALGSSPYLARLRELNLATNEIGGNGARALAKSPHLVRLAILSLQSCRIGTVGAMALASAKAFSSLSQLLLWSNAIGDAGVAALARSPHLAGLATLDVGGNNLTDDGAIALADSPHLTNLAELVVGCNYDIGPVGAEALFTRFGVLVRNSLIDILQIHKHRAWQEADWEEEALSAHGKYVEAILTKVSARPA